MKLQLLWLFDDGREVWTDGRGTIERQGRSWIYAGGVRCIEPHSNPETNALFESARADALMVDSISRIPDVGTYVTKGKKWMIFEDDEAATCDDLFGRITQAQAFRWLFMGRLD